MKAIVKKISMFTMLAAVLLLTAVFVISCMDVLNPSKLGLDEKESQEGTRYVRLVIGESYARTIMPDDNPTWTHFDVYFNVKPTGVTIADRIAVTAANLNTPAIELGLGTYEILVNAYLDDPTLATPIAATWEDTVVVGSTTSTIDVLLEPITDTTGGADGTFKWNLSYTGGPAFTALDSATMNIYPLNNFTTPLAAFPEVDLTADRTDLTGVDLDPGFYHVRVELELADHQTAMVTEVLHIYQGMDSVYTRTFSALNRNAYTVTFNYLEDDGTIATSGTETITSHAHNTVIATSAIPNAGGPYLRAGYTLTGDWFRNYNEGTGVYTNQWNFGTGGNVVLGDRTLYAEWEPSSRTVGLVPEYDASDELIGIALATSTIDYFDITGPGTVNIAINGYAGLGATSITWMINSIESNAHPLVIDNTYLSFTTGTPIDISVTMIIDGKPYSGLLTLTFTNTTGL